MSHADKDECHWNEDSDGNWETGCANMFVFTAEGPSGNGFVYCPYCGGVLKEHLLDEHSRSW